MPLPLAYKSDCKLIELNVFLIHWSIIHLKALSPVRSAADVNENTASCLPYMNNHIQRQYRSARNRLAMNQFANVCTYCHSEQGCCGVAGWSTELALLVAQLNCICSMHVHRTTGLGQITRKKKCVALSKFECQYCVVTTSNLYIRLYLSVRLA